MTKKTDLRRIGMVMLVLCTALIMTVLPAAANYTADKPLVTNATGTVTGGMNYTIGDSYYSPKMWSNDTYVYGVTLPDGLDGLPTGSTIQKMRLYVYWTWSYNETYSANNMYDTGVEAEMDVDFNGAVLSNPDAKYIDWKNDTGWNRTSYNYPCGTYVYDVTGWSDSYPVNITNTYGAAYNQSFNIQAVGLLVLYNTPGGNTSYYWIDEGCDSTYTCWKNTTNEWLYGITPDDAVSLANFSGVDTTNLNSAKLITCVPSGDSIYNRLYFNYFPNFKYWNGPWNADPYADFSWTETDVKDNLIDGINYVGFQNGLYTMIPNPRTKYNQERQMVATNAFLLLTYNSP